MSKVWNVPVYPECYIFNIFRIKIYSGERAIGALVIEKTIHLFQYNLLSTMKHYLVLVKL